MEKLFFGLKSVRKENSRRLKNLNKRKYWSNFDFLDFDIDLVKKFFIIKEVKFLLDIVLYS